MTVTYPPLNQLKPVCDDLWIVDGPQIRYGPPGLKFAFPTRMTIVHLGGGALFVHSPTELTPGLRAQVAAIGMPRWLIGPNRIHYWWIPDWRNAYPEAEVFLAPGIDAQSRGRIDFPFSALERDRGYPWDDRIETLAVSGSYMTEFVFFDRATRTLVLTDLIENFEPRKLGSPLTRWLTRLGGVQDPHGSMPRDMRLTFRRHKSDLKRAIEQLIAWDPQRIILAHGRWYERDGTAELRRAFAWLLD